MQKKGFQKSAFYKAKQLYNLRKTGDFMANNWNAIFIICLVVVITTSMVSLAFFDAPLSVIVRNDILSVAIFLLLYYIWTKVNQNYERFFRLGLGR